MERRRLASDQIQQIEDARLARNEHASSDGPHAIVRPVGGVIGIGIETADMLVKGAGGQATGARIEDLASRG
jgi:hypothetical protein